MRSPRKGGRSDRVRSIKEQETENGRWAPVDDCDDALAGYVQSSNLAGKKLCLSMIVCCSAAIISATEEDTPVPNVDLV